MTDPDLATASKDGSDPILPDRPRTRLIQPVLRESLQRSKPIFGGIGPLLSSSNPSFNGVMQLPGVFRWCLCRRVFM